LKIRKTEKQENKNLEKNKSGNEETRKSKIRKIRKIENQENKNLEKINSKKTKSEREIKMFFLFLFLLTKFKGTTIYMISALYVCQR
jgi:hypothetical protein